MKYSTQKDIDKFVRQLVRKGWIFWHGAKHGRLRHPSQQKTLTVPSSPSDRRASDNFTRDVYRMTRELSACMDIDKNS